MRAALILATALAPAFAADAPRREPPSLPAASVTQALLRSPAALTAANPVSAGTLAHAGVSAVFIDAASAERGQVAAVVRAARETAVIGRFEDARDVELKPKLDEGLSGALLEKAESLKDALRFLRRLYLPPLGERSVGPSDVTGYLSRTKDFLASNNARFQGGLSVSTEKGAARIDALVKAKARGLTFIEVGQGLSPVSAIRVEKVARDAGLAVVTSPPTDAQAVDAAFARYADVPLQPHFEPLPRATLRATLSQGRLAQLGFLMSPDEAMARRLAEGAGALWIDAEDGQFTLEKVRAMLRALPPGRQAVVRAVEWNDPHIAEYLAAGAAGVVAPQISHAWQARAFVAAVRRANPDALAVVMIETQRGLAHAEEIASVPGVDLIFVGPNDLALSLRTSQDSPAFAAALARIEAVARAAGVPLGNLAKTRGEAYALRARGYRLVATVSDQTALTLRFRTAPGETPTH